LTRNPVASNRPDEKGTQPFNGNAALILLLLRLKRVASAFRAPRSLAAAFNESRGQPA
jgi:hypothetical protein